MGGCICCGDVVVDEIFDDVCGSEGRVRSVCVLLKDSESGRSSSRAYRRPGYIAYWLVLVIWLSRPGEGKCRAFEPSVTPTPQSVGRLLPRDRSGHVDVVWQDHVFPLPRSSGPRRRANLSRGTRQRVNAEEAVQSRVDEVCRGLNCMSGP